MKKFIPFVTALSLVFLTTGCQQELTTRSVKGVYEIGVPNDMKVATSLNQDASLQYENIFKETYLAIIDEDREAFESAYNLYGGIDSTKSVISNYAKIQVDFFMEGVKALERKDPKQLTINGMEAEQVEFTAKVEGVDGNIYYLMTFVQGEKNVYMVMMWTFEKSKDKYRDLFVSMADSFREL